MLDMKIALLQKRIDAGKVEDASEKVQEAAIDAMIQMAEYETQKENAEFDKKKSTSDVLDSDQRKDWDGQWKTYNYQKSTLDKHRGNTYSLLEGQCLQTMKDQLIHDPVWDAVQKEGKPLYLGCFSFRSCPHNTVKSNTQSRLLMTTH